MTARKPRAKAGAKSAPTADERARGQRAALLEFVEWWQGQIAILDRMWCQVRTVRREVEEHTDGLLASYLCLGDLKDMETHLSDLSLDFSAHAPAPPLDVPDSIPDLLERLRG